MRWSPDSLTSVWTRYCLSCSVRAVSLMCVGSRHQGTESGRHGRFVRHRLDRIRSVPSRGTLLFVSSSKDNPKVPSESRVDRSFSHRSSVTGRVQPWVGHSTYKSFRKSFSQSRISKFFFCFFCYRNFGWTPPRRFTCDA